MNSPPSETELELLKILWREGPQSAREIQDQLPPGLDWSASTTRTVLERMRGKDLLVRRSVHGLAVYEAARAKADVVGGMLRRVMRQMLEVEGPLPAAAFSGSQILSPDELAEIEAMLNAGTEKDASKDRVA